MKEISSILRGNIYERHYRKFARHASSPIDAFSQIQRASGGIPPLSCEMIIIDFGDPDKLQLDHWQVK